MKRLCEILETLLKLVLCLLVSAMTLTVVWQVLTRLTFKLCTGIGVAPFLSPSKGTEELAGFLLAWTALLGAVYAFRRGEHLGFDLLYQAMSDRTKARADVAAFVLEILFCAVVLLYGGSRLVAITLHLGQTTSILRWPMGALYTVLPLSGGLMTLFALDALVKRMAGEERTA